MAETLFATPESVELEVPPEVDLILSAMDAGGHVSTDRRAATRMRYRVCAWLRLFSDGPSAQPTPIYTRDLHPRGLGFITSRRLPLGHGGVIELSGGGSIYCTVLRCREATPGWYEGCVYFNREQSQLMP